MFFQTGLIIRNKIAQLSLAGILAVLVLGYHVIHKRFSSYRSGKLASSDGAEDLAVFFYFPIEVRPIFKEEIEVLDRKTEFLSQLFEGCRDFYFKILLFLGLGFFQTFFNFWIFLF